MTKEELLKRARHEWDDANNPPNIGEVIHELEACLEREVVLRRALADYANGGPPEFRGRAKNAINKVDLMK